MCKLLHRYTVFVILFANGTPFYNSGLVKFSKLKKRFGFECCADRQQKEEPNYSDIRKH